MIEEIPVDRARIRTTLTYQVTPRLRLGIEVNPLDDDVGPLVNWRVLDETESRPAVVLGTSSDRIGTPSKRAVYATASKDLEQWTGLPIAPYAGITYSGFDRDLDPIGGLSVRLTDRLSTTHLFDGDNVHHLLGYTFENGMSVGLLYVGQSGEDYWGLTLGGWFDPTSWFPEGTFD